MLQKDLHNRCPLEIDGETDINKMCEDYGYTQPFYKDTLVSLITETNYNARRMYFDRKIIQAYV